MTQLPYLFRTQAQEKRISSLEIAKVVNKAHKNIMRDIRGMESAWEKIAGLKFELSEYVDSTGRHLPCYSLSKLETLFIATKFNDEARARLVMYCDYLEKKERARVHDDLVYLNNVLQSEDTLTTTMIAKEHDLTARQVNRILHEEGLIFKQSGQWFLYAPHHGKNLVDYETWPDIEHGHHRTHRQMRWTEEGHRYVNDMVEQYLERKALEMKPRYIEGTIAFIFF